MNEDESEELKVQNMEETDKEVVLHAAPQPTMTVEKKQEPPREPPKEEYTNKQDVMYLNKLEARSQHQANYQMAEHEALQFHRTDGKGSEFLLFSV